MHRKTKPIAAAVAGILFTPTAQATNGYMSHGYGAIGKSMAGACVAITESILCGANNPANLALMNNGIELGVDMFSPSDRGYTANDDGWPPPFPSIEPGKVKSENDYFFIPNFGWNKRLDDKSTFSILVAGQGGMNTEYDRAVFGNFSSPGNEAGEPTGMDMSQLFAGFSYSRRINEQHSLGIMPILLMQSMKVNGLQPFQPWSIHPDKVTNNGKDWSYGGGVRAGWLYSPNEKVNLGLSYQTKLWTTDFDEYKGLLADEGNFDVPAILDLGASVNVTPKLLLAFNYQRIFYSDIKSIGNAADLAFPFPPEPMLGTKDGLGFGWDDVDVYKFGLRWKYRDDLVFRAGYSWASQTFANTQALFNILAPAVVQSHFTLGLGKQFRSGNELNLAIMYAPEEKVEGTNPNTGPQTGDVFMEQWEISLGYRWNM